MQLCDYGCGQEAKYQFKNGKWCCSKVVTSCQEIKRRNSETNKIKQTGENNGMYGKKHSIESIIKNSKSNKKQWADKNSTFNSNIYRKKLKKALIIVGKNRRRTIEMIKEKYPLYSIIEEMRYNPDKPEEKEIQVHCKNSNCPNSKEKGGWFTPAYYQLYERIRNIEQHGLDNSYYYCCDACKNECPMFNMRKDPYENTDGEIFYTTEEYKTFRELVLKRDKFQCQICGEEANHVHHERPQKLEPFFALDPDLAWSLCTKCHYKYGHKDECSTGNLANKQCIK